MLKWTPNELINVSINKSIGYEKFQFIFENLQSIIIYFNEVMDVGMMQSK